MNEKNIGKTLGTDLQHGKFTLPVLLLLESCSEPERKKWHDYLLHKKEKDFHELGATLLEQGALKNAVAEAQRLIEDANKKLDLLEQNSYVEGLRGIATYILGILQTIT